MHGSVLRIEGEEDLRDPPRLTRDTDVVAVARPIGDASWARLGRLMEGHPDVQLFVNHSTEDLELLRHFRGLRRFGVRSLDLRSWSGLRHVADTLEELRMGDGTVRPISIAPLADLPRLTALSLIGPVRDVGIIGRLSRLEDLQLRAVTLSDLSLLMPMARLRVLHIGLGGTSDLSLLPALRGVEDLELWRIRGLRDVSMLGSMPSLSSLILDAMSAITELPSFRGATALRRVALTAMKGIANLAPLAEAPNLEELLLIDMPQMNAAAIRPFVGHPTLRRGVWGFGSVKRNVAAYDLLPLGDPPFGHPEHEKWLASQPEASEPASD